MTCIAHVASQTHELFIALCTVVEQDMHVKVGCIEAELGHARDTKYPSGRREWAGAVIEVGRGVAVHCSGLSAGKRYRDSHVGGRCEWWVRVIGSAQIDRHC